MTTRVHNYNKLQWVALLLLFLTGSLPVMAQDDEYYDVGEAFYIYQNDGHFDGFFVDDVEQISYSRLDTLGREHDHYVSQEIVTADSTYRIMLTAIDSVSFVQPMNPLQKNVVMMEYQGLMDYFITSLDMQLAFDLSMPSYLRPKVGDVLACPELDGHEGAFVGKVKSVAERGGFLVVGCDYVDKLGDVFDRLVGVEKVTNVQTAYGSRTLRRVSGMPPQMARAKARKRIEGNVDEFTLFAFDASLSGSVDFGKLNLGLGVNAGFGMTINAAYNIGWDHFYVKQEVKEQVAAGLTVLLDGELYNNADLTALPGVGALLKRFSRVPFPSVFPILYANVTPTPFARAEAHLVLSMSSGLQLQALAQSIELKDSWPFISVQMNPVAPFLPLPSTLKPDGSFTINAQLNGTFQSGMKFPLETGVEDWLQKLVNVKLENVLYAGPKVYGQLNFDLLKSTKGAYEALGDSKVDLSLMSFDSEFSAQGSILGHDAEFKKVFTWKYGNYTLKMFPAISDAKFEVTGDLQNTITGSFNVKGDVCMPETVGFGIYAKENKNAKDYDKLVRHITRNELYFLNTFNSVDLSMENVEPGVYMVRPVVAGPLGIVPVYEGQQLLTVAQKDLQLKPESIQAEEQGGTYEVQLLAGVDMPLNAYPQDDWITCEVKRDEGTRTSMLYVTVKENTTDHYRHGTVIVRLRLTTDEMVERTLDVYQFGGLELDPKVLTFLPVDRKRPVEILTSYRPITISVPDEAKEWLTVEQDSARFLSIFAKENKGANREAVITVSAWSEKHKGISAVDLIVKQEGPVDVSLEKYKLKFGSDGGGERVNIDMSDYYDFTDIGIRIDGQGWLTAERGGNYFIVNCMPNDTGEERWSYVYLTFTKRSSDLIGPDTYELPVLIEQELGGTPGPGPGPGPELIGDIPVSNMTIGTLEGYKVEGTNSPVQMNLYLWDSSLAQSWDGEVTGPVATMYDDHIHVSGALKWDWYDEEDEGNGTVQSTTEFDIVKTKDEAGNVTLYVDNFKFVDDEKKAMRPWYGDSYDSKVHMELEIDFSAFTQHPVTTLSDNITIVDGGFNIVNINMDTNHGLAFKRFVYTEDIEKYESTYVDGEWQDVLTKSRKEWQPYMTADEPMRLNFNFGVTFDDYDKWKEWLLR